jgi:hypothetical protein
VIPLRERVTNNLKGIDSDERTVTEVESLDKTRFLAGAMFD